MRRGLYCGMRRRFCREMTKYYNSKPKKTYTYFSNNQSKPNTNSYDADMGLGILFATVLGFGAIVLLLTHPVIFICLFIFFIFCATRSL